MTRASGSRVHGVPGGAEDEFAEPGLAAMGGGTDCGSILQPRLWRSNELVTSPSDAANTSVAIEIVGDGVGTDTLLASARPSPSRATSHGGIVRRAGARSWSRRLQPSGRGRRRARVAGCSDGVRRAASRRSAPRNRNPVSARCNFLVLDPSIGALEWGGSGMVELTAGRMPRSGERAPPTARPSACAANACTGQ